MSGIFAACSKNEPESTLPSGGLDDNADEVELVVETVTDEEGEAVTDKDGNPVTTIVTRAVTTKKGDKDKNGNNSENGNKDDNGDNGSNGGNSGNSGNGGNSNTVDKENDTLPTNPTENQIATTNPKIPLTESAKTTAFKGKETVPPLSATGKEVSFSEKDMGLVQSMLEVPYLYTADYENSQGVPIEIASHVAVWMAEHEGSTRKVYPSSPVVLNLFKYFGQTVVNFKSQCNTVREKSETPAPITYNKNDDTFTISEFTSKKQDVKITKIEDLGNNNFYKVTATVTGCEKSKVVAIIQKNRLDVSLGFSIKALKWS